MPTHNYATNEWIFREGEPATHAFVVHAGTVQLTRSNSDIPLNAVVPGGCFGEAALLGTDAHYGYSAMAIEDCVLASVTRDEFAALAAQAPALLRPFAAQAFEAWGRTMLRSHGAPNQQTKIEGVRRVTISAGSDTLLHSIPHPIEVPLNRLPYKIGGYPDGGEINSADSNNLYLPSKASPLVISRQQCQLDAADGALLMQDLGSRFNTLVNEHMLGRGRGLYKAPLHLGDNLVRLGGYDSPYLLTVTVE